MCYAGYWHFFFSERPSIANPYGRAMMNEGVEVVVVIKTAQKRRRRGLATATCSALVGSATSGN